MKTFKLLRGYKEESTEPSNDYPPPIISDYHGNYAAYNEAMRRYLYSDFLRRNRVTSEHNMMEHIQRIRDFNDNIVDINKPNWWTRVRKMKYESFGSWYKRIEWDVIIPITMVILIVFIPMFYMLIYHLISKR